jgi:hypothetical protein
LPSSRPTAWSFLDAKDGKTLAFEKWETSYQTNASTPIIKEDKIFISTGYRRGCALFQWNGKSLKKIYENKNLSTHMNHAILVDDYLYGFDGNVHMAGPKDFACIQFSTGKEQWRVNDRGLQVGSLLVAGDRMLILGQRGEGVIAKINPKRFEVINREQIIGGKTWTMPILPTDFFMPEMPGVICSALGFKLKKYYEFVFFCYFLLI